MAGVEDLTGLAYRLFLGLLARSLDELHLGTVSTNLSDLCRRGIGRRQYFDAHSAGRTIRRNGCAAISGAILQHRIDAKLPEIRQHHGGAAILEAASRVEPFQLEERPEIVPFLLHQRGAAFAQRNRFGDFHGQRCLISPERSHAAVDFIARDAGLRTDQQRHLPVGAPARNIQRIAVAASGLDVEGCFRLSSGLGHQRVPHPAARQSIVRCRMPPTPCESTLPIVSRQGRLD